MLLFTGAHFLAILEGEERAQNYLWKRLEQDQRHCDLFRIGDESCETRLYPGWAMGFLVDSEVDAQIESMRSLQMGSAIDRGRTRVRSSAPAWARIIQPIMSHADCM